MARPTGRLPTASLTLLLICSAGCNKSTTGRTPPPVLGADSLTATIPVPGGPYGIAVAGNGAVYATIPGRGVLARISLSTLSVVRSVTVGAVPTGVAFTPNGATAYVTNQLDGNLGVVDVARDSEVATISVHGNPFVTLPSPDGSRVIVACNDDSIFVVNPGTRSVVASRYVGIAPNGLVFNTAGTRLYVSNSFGGTVAEVDPAVPAVLRTFTTGGMPQGIALSGDGTLLYVANQAGWLEVRSVDTFARLDSIPLAGPAFGLARSPDDGVVYVGLYTIGEVAVVNRATRQVIKTLVTGGEPRRIAFTADGRHAVIANASGWVDVVTR